MSLSKYIILQGDDYRILHAIGEGAYGTVVAAIHKPSGRQVAIKKVLPFDHTLFCLRTLREIKLLKFFSESGINENVNPFSSLEIILSLNMYSDYFYSGHGEANVEGCLQGDLL